jgi:hypothetical protein
MIGSCGSNEASRTGSKLTALDVTSIAPINELREALLDFEDYGPQITATCALAGVALD